MSGMQAPTAATLEVFLASNPGWEVLPEEDTESSDEEEEKMDNEGRSRGVGRWVMGSLVMICGRLLLWFTFLFFSLCI